MPLPPNTETKIPQIIADYAHTRRTDLSLPDSTALPFVVGPVITEQTFPRVVFVTTSTGVPHPKRLDMVISVELQTSASDEVIADESAWAAAIRFVLADRAAFMTWLGAQTEAIRTGYSIRSYRVSDTSMAIDDKTGIRARRADIAVQVRTDELSAS
jgi:hypothetical protein